MFDTTTIVAVIKAKVTHLVKHLAKRLAFTVSSVFLHHTRPESFG